MSKNQPKLSRDLNVYHRLRKFITRHVHLFITRVWSQNCQKCVIMTHITPMYVFSAIYKNLSIFIALSLTSFMRKWCTQAATGWTPKLIYTSLIDNLIPGRTFIFTLLLLCSCKILTFAHTFFTTFASTIRSINLSSLLDAL